MPVANYVVKLLCRKLEYMPLSHIRHVKTRDVVRRLALWDRDEYKMAGRLLVRPGFIDWGTRAGSG